MLISTLQEQTPTGKKDATRGCRERALRNIGLGKNPTTLLTRYDGSTSSAAGASPFGVVGGVYDSAAIFLMSMLLALLLV